MKSISPWLNAGDFCFNIIILHYFATFYTFTSFNYQNSITMLEKLTPDQIKLMDTIKQKWLDRIFKHNNTFDEQKCREGIDWLYSLSNLKKPIVIVVDSPYSAQFACGYAKSLINEYYKQLGLESQVWSQVRSQVESQVESQVRSQVESQVWSQVESQIRSQVWSQVESQVEYEYFASYGNISDFGWLSFYEFFKEIGIFKHELFNKFTDLINSGIYESIQLDGLCVVCKLPEKIIRKVDKLHNSTGPAIEWQDGYKLYFWNGVCVPEKAILSPDKITKEDIVKESNAEIRRCYMEILGAKKYYDIISDGKGLTLIDEDMDNQGFPMKLYQTSINDSIIDKKIQFIEVIDPSTGRMYNIYPPKQNCTNVWEAKSSTFNMQKGKYRQGDVMLKQVDKEFDLPLIET